MKYFYIIVLLFSLPNKALCMFDTLDFDQVRESGGFSSLSLKNVISITPSQQSLNQEEVRALANSTTLKNLRTLNLKDQENVNDEFVRTLSNNPTFSRIINLNLSGTNITRQSFNYILESNSLGQIRDLPQVSGRFGVPSSMIYVRVEDIQNLPKKEIEEFNRGNKKKNNFTIQYMHPAKGIESSPPATGIKMLEIKDY